MTEQERVKEFMTAQGFKLVTPHDGSPNIWFNQEKQIVEIQTLATFFYRLTLEAQRDTLKAVRLESEVTPNGAKYLDDRIAELDRLLEQKP